jgi:hypothetical protein
MKEAEFIQIFERPKLPYMARNFAGALLQWSKSGFRYVHPDKYEKRLNICKECQFWDEQAFMGTGRCKKCGCSIRMKLSLSTSKCPLNLWGSELASSAVEVGQKTDQA